MLFWGIYSFLRQSKIHVYVIYVLVNILLKFLSEGDNVYYEK